MAVLFRQTCGACGAAVVTKGTGSKAHYVHVTEMRGIRADHQVAKVVATNLGRI